jgi:GTP-binding protein
VFEVSAVTREGLRGFGYAVAETVERHRAAQPLPEATRIVLRPTAVDDTGYGIEPAPDGCFVVRGAKPERWVRQTDFSNDEAVGYLADRLARIGLEEDLVKLGAEPGATVRIGDVEFEWQPTVYAGAEFTPGARGSDYRFDRSTRKRAATRLAEHRGRIRHPGSAPAEESHSGNSE